PCAVGKACRGGCGDLRAIAQDRIVRGVSDRRPGKGGGVCREADQGRRDRHRRDAIDRLAECPAEEVALQVYRLDRAVGRGDRDQVHMVLVIGRIEVRARGVRGTAAD
ncbi:MAG: hypothetical protein ACK55I_19165, partial [bacterium]